MTGRRGNHPHRFGGTKKPPMQNQNRNRMGGGIKANYSGGGLMNQVNPWISQNSNSNSYNSIGRNIVNDPQAQLALASNLLNNLLSPSQLNKLSQGKSSIKPVNSFQPPSLLSLGNMSDSGSSFGNSQPYNRDRFNSGRVNQGKIQKRDDFKKQDFNKNKRFGNDRNKNAGLKKPDQFNKKSAVVDEKNVEKKDTTTAATTSATIIKEEVNVDNTDKEQSVSGSITVNVTKQSAANANEAKPKVAQEVKPEPETKKDDDKSEEVKANYSDVPPALLFCHICRKHMWDDTSFEKHLEGRPHKMMVEELDQSYKLKVDLLRHEMRVMEQQRENDIHRAQRKGKSNVKSQQRGFCTMCNLSFLGMLPAHRKNEKHQKLKKFLHPKCNVCSKEFYTRLEWDDHKLTPNHLKKLAEIRKASRPDLEDTEFDIADFIEDMNDEIEAEGADFKITGRRETMDELKNETKETDGNAVEGEEENGEEVEKEAKTEEDEDTKKLPKYSPGIPVGENFVIEKTGHVCRVCNRFMLTQEDIKIHCQTVVHYTNIIKVLKAQNKINRKRRLNETKSEENGKQVENDAKRIKLEESAVTVAPMETDVNGSVNQSLDESKGSEQYDPENPESENEKDAELNDEQLKQNFDIKETKVVLEDIQKETKVEEPVKQEVVEPPKEVRRPVGRSPGGRGGPRGRRGRRSHM